MVEFKSKLKLYHEKSWQNISAFLSIFFQYRDLEKMERRDLKDERIQIPNEDLTVEMFDIDKKDFESGEAFLKADMKVKKIF